jgi:hypothetical protein
LTAVETFLLLRAHPHRWGNGLVHQIDQDRDQTLCGKSPANCPGDKFWAPADQITCNSCKRSLAAKERNAEILRSLQHQRQQWEENDRRWWQAYNTYLASPTWATKRRRVLERANGQCEGCGDRRAVQVHHLRYPQHCLPGSPEWIAQEKLRRNHTATYTATIPADYACVSLSL